MFLQVTFKIFKEGLEQQTKGVSLRIKDPLYLKLDIRQCLLNAALTVKGDVIEASHIIAVSGLKNPEKLRDGLIAD